MSESKAMASARKVAWAYCRVSTTKDEQELSLEEQVRWANEYARAEGCELVVFQERASAKTILARRECVRMLGELDSLPRAARPQLLLATSFDRLSRDLLDSATLYGSLKRTGVKLYIRDRGIVPMKSFSDVAVLIGHAMGGHAENEARSMRAKASWDRRRREGKPTSNKVPYGIQLRNERDVPAEESATWVSRAFEWYSKGFGMHTIAVRLAAYAPPHRTVSSRIGADGNPITRERRPVWESNRVRKLLEQRRYRGTIVDEALFDQVQELLTQTPKYRQIRGFEYPLSGAVKCGTCGRSFHGHATGGSTTRRMANGEKRRYLRTKRVRYYQCTVCHYMINGDLLESWFRRDLQMLAADDDLLGKWVAGSSTPIDLQALKEEAEKAEQRLTSDVFNAKRNRAWDIAQSGDANVAADLPRQLERIASEERAARERVAELRRILDQREVVSRTLEGVTKLLADFWKLYDGANYGRKRELVGAVVTALGGAVASKGGLVWKFSRIGSERVRENGSFARTRIL